MDRQAQFRAREVLIFQVAEQLLLENGEAGMTLDVLAAELDLAKGTLYKHFQSKDELYMLLIIRNERMLLEMVQDTEKAFPEHLAFFMLHHLHHPERTVYSIKLRKNSQSLLKAYIIFFTNFIRCVNRDCELSFA